MTTDFRTTSTAPVTDDFPEYSLQGFGFSPKEIELAITQMNGCEPYTRGWYSNELSDGLCAAAASSAEDHAAFGCDLSFPRNDSAEMPAKIQRLAEKIAQLEDWQKTAFRFFVDGFWSGISVAHKQAAELANASRQTDRDLHAK